MHRRTINMCGNMQNAPRNISLPTYKETSNNIPGKQQVGISNTFDMQRLVELINTTDDSELLAKLFTVLAVYLVSNETDKSDIITSNHIYDKLRNVLNNGQSLKTVRTLNFITALLYQGDGDESPPTSRARTLILYAQNMIRISGCLLLMCNMFTNCMLHQETWRALCQCLAESCRNSTENQSYCSHLVPMAVQKCIQGNEEAMEILKCLLYNHEYNIQLFAESNGITIFNKRETLLNDTSMQLLNSLVQNATQELLVLIHETLFQNLSNLKHLYGTQNRMKLARDLCPAVGSYRLKTRDEISSYLCPQIGQWATIIWHHLNSRIKVAKGFNASDNSKDINTGNGKEIAESSVIDIGYLKPDDTARLLQNVIREIHTYNTKTNTAQKIGRHTDDKSKNEIQFYDVNKNQQKKTHLSQNTQVANVAMQTHRNKSRNLLDPNINEMSFSFLLKDHSHGSNIGFIKNSKTFRSQINKNPTSKNNSHCVQMETKSTDMTNIHFSQRDTTFFSGVSDINHEGPSLLEFNPVCVSTPKKNKENNKSQNSYCRSRHNTINKNEKVIDKTTNRKTRYFKDRVTTKRDLKNRSMTSRLFNAINDSCTTFVKTVKNIFKSKKNDKITTGNSIEPSCSYSFTDYMRKRDALLSNESVENENNLGEDCETKNMKFCKTCNDTVSLKYKVNNDHYLKETVTKLKLGINVYGCDFKKISKAMWPRETYMTPEVLYNLYRKLIIK